MQIFTRLRHGLQYHLLKVNYMLVNIDADQFTYLVAWINTLNFGYNEYVGQTDSSASSEVHYIRKYDAEHVKI